MSFYSQSSTTPGQSSEASRGPAYASSSYAPVGLSAAKPASISQKQKAQKEKPKKLRAGGGKVWEDRTLDEFDESIKL